MTRLDATLRDKITRLHREGHNQVSISKILGCSISAACKVLYQEPTLTENEYLHERWRHVVGWQGKYKVSDLGRVRSVDRMVRCRNNGKRTIRGKILSPSRNAYGHCQVQLNRKGQSFMYPVHTLVITAFIGPRPPGKECCHGPGGRADNRLHNLRYDTRAENMWEAVVAGTAGCLRRSPDPASIVRSWRDSLVTRVTYSSRDSSTTRL